SGRGFRSPRTIVAAVVGHALRVGVCHLILQAFAHLLLQHGLQCVVSHVAVRLRARSELRYSTEERSVVCEERARSRTRSRAGCAWSEQLALRVGERHHQVRSSLTNIANLKRRVAPELALHRQVPLIRQGRLYIWIPNTKQRARKARIVRASRSRRSCPHNTVRGGSCRQRDAVVRDV